MIRSTKDNPDVVQVLPTFSPKVFATRQRFRDTALESRCLTEIMQETTRGDIPYLLPKKFYEKETELRNKLLMFRFKNRAKVDTESAQDIFADLEDIEPRLKQATASFAVVFSNIDGVMSDFKRFLKNFNAELVEQRANTNEGLVINAIFELVSSSNTHSNRDDTHDSFDTEVSSQDIERYIQEKYGVEIHYRRIGNMLRNFGLETKKRKIEDKTKRCLVWEARKMKVLKRRYIPSESDVLDDTDKTKGQGSQESQTYGRARLMMTP